MMEFELVDLFLHVETDHSLSAPDVVRHNNQSGSEILIQLLLCQGILK